jgi:hypothetical protein
VKPAVYIHQLRSEEVFDVVKPGKAVMGPLTIIRYGHGVAYEPVNK